MAIPKSLDSVSQDPIIHQLLYTKAFNERNGRITWGAKGDEDESVTITMMYHLTNLDE